MNSPLGAGLKRAIWALSLPKTHSLIPNEAATDWQTTYSFPGTSNSTIYVTVLYQRLESSCIKRAFLRYGILVGNIFAEASEAIQRKIPSNSSSREDLQFLHSAINDLWIFVGYFNAIIGAHERLGGEIPTCAYFSEAISSCNTITNSLPETCFSRAKQEFEFVLIITEASSCLFLSSNQRGTRVAITFLFFAFVVLIRYDRSESASRSSLRSSRIDESLRTGWIDGFLKPSFDQWIPFLSSPAGLQLP
ncbi:hypothetical protein QYF36_001180 [Acer negundo]|nr:hypothetical protein QYF36_001180 [Acer negundo]